MVSWISTWAQGIIIAVIIATIVEMILPIGTMKKYIKVIIGIYIMFIIMTPIVEKFGGGKIDLNNLLNTTQYEEKMSESSNNVSSKLESNSSKSIKDIYIENIKNDITKNLKQKGYKTNSIYVNADDSEDYGISKIELNIEKNSIENNSSDLVNKVNIEVDNIDFLDKKNRSKDKLTEEDKKEISNYLIDTYNINPNIIFIE